MRAKAGPIQTVLVIVGKPFTLTCHERLEDPLKTKYNFKEKKDEGREE